MNKQKFLFLALCKGGLGETILGIRIANELHKRGDSVSFLAHTASALAYKGAPFPVELLDDRLGALLPHLVDGCVINERPTCIIVCDLFTNSVFFRDARVDPEFLSRYGIPIIGLDTWHFGESGNRIDLYLDKSTEISPWVAKLKHRLIPVPIARPIAQPGMYSNLPPPVVIGREVRNQLRVNLGLGSSDRSVLFCTANWQQAPYPNDHAKRLGDGVPLLLAQYLNQIGTQTHMVHVGPSEYPLEEILGDRYHWIPPLQPNEFDLLLGSVDLLLSVNISATTVTKAIVSEIPTMVLQNSLRAETLEEAESSLSNGPSRILVNWVKEVLPLFPFSLWPSGWHAFLAPVLRANDYARAAGLTELLNEEQIVHTCKELLFSVTARHDHLQRRTEYLNKVRQLPSAPDVIDSFTS